MLPVPHPVRMRQVIAQCDALTNNVEIVLSKIEELEKRLDSVLSAPPPRTNNKDLNPEPDLPLATHAAFLRGKNALLLDAVGRLERLMERLEI